MKIEFKDIVKLQRLYMEIFEEEDSFPVDYRIVKNKQRAVIRILNKITDDKEKQAKILDCIVLGSWDRNDNTYKPICDNLRDLGFEIIGSDIK